MSIARHHAEWLSLVEVSGPFLSMPVLMQAFPQGLNAHDPELRRELKMAWEEWESQSNNPAIHQAWIQFVLKNVLEFPDEVIAEGPTLSAELRAFIAVHNETLSPDRAILTPPGLPHSGHARLLIQVLRPSQNLNTPLAEKHWKASPATRMMELLHATNVPLGLVTNGEHWMLVHAPRGETTGFISWFAPLWLEEPLTLRAFQSLLNVRRFFGVGSAETIESLLSQSAQDQQEVTDQLGYQVRRAVEVLVQALDRLDLDTGRTLLSGVNEKQLYEAALTVMMRLVFLFAAEERGLLLLGEPLYDENYAVSTLRETLHELAEQHGEEVLERRFDAWSRLLATFRVVFGGVTHEDLRLPPYGGHLFDPDRFPFLEGRPAGTHWQTQPAAPLKINNRTVLHLLDSLQILQVKVPGGGPAEARRVSFRALDIEQIGHVYEGLLDHTAKRAQTPVLGLAGTKNKEPEIELSQLEQLRQTGIRALLDFLKSETGRGTPALQRALEMPEISDEHRLLAACGNDDALFQGVKPFAGLLRQDTFGYPVVIPAGSVYVTQGSDRRSTGTHYTPRSLTEPIVKHALDPLVYHGPAEGLPEEEWQLKPPHEILQIRVCDMAMGSGAFLVQACRYLAERLVEAWETSQQDPGCPTPGRIPGVGPNSTIDETKHPVSRSTRQPGFADTEDHKNVGIIDEQLVGTNPEERLVIARRYVADRCLFGVDINPMAVEMAKLSLWLVTLKKDRPFTFLDHALKCGDSLLGLHHENQLRFFSLTEEQGKQGLILEFLEKETDRAIEKRQQLEAIPCVDFVQIEQKQRLLTEAEALTEKLRLAADMLVAAELTPGTAKQKELARRDAHIQVVKLWHHAPIEEFRAAVRTALQGRRPFHWPLEFPEVMRNGGFDAFVGNPPFMGGKKITTNFGTEYRDFILYHVANGVKGHADLCAYFFLRTKHLLHNNGGAGLLATNTIAQGDTREVGLEQLAHNNFSFYRAVPSRKWPGTASLEVAHVWFRKGSWKGTFSLENKIVRGITPLLTITGKATGKPYRLAANANKSFNGSYVLGMGFVLTPGEANSLIKKNPHNKNVLFQFLNGQDLNSRFDQSPSRWVINFFDWPLNRSASGSWRTADEKQRKEWLRNGIVPGDYPESVAADYPDCLEIVEAKVKPERTRKKANGKFALRYPLYLKWWIYGEKRPALYSTIKNMERVVTIAATSRTLAFELSFSNIVFSHATYVFVYDNVAYFALLQSVFHEVWARRYSSSMKKDLRYTPGDVFETFAMPEQTESLELIGQKYYDDRKKIMKERQEGLTTTYNRFHAESETAADIQHLRELHIEMDQAVAAAYGWHDLDLGHGFHETKQGRRFTISEPARREVLDRLLQLNHERYVEEVKQGLHAKGQQKKAKRPKVRKGNGTGGLFGE